jgi:baculoviral IAP repeat-containing protein 6
LKNGPHISRVARELAGLASTLPLSRSSSALVRVDERRAVQWTILITGPEDTPYDCGAFLFDAFFPSSYPTSAPLVKFRTTGGGRVRFNPNLYKDGKVCLSLLGTWSGAKGETWDAASSTMLQVIVSIQSLILCAQPYFNEPGYERTIGTPEGDRQSSQYNAAIREHALRCAMIDQLKKPPAPFAEAIRAHFRERKERLMGPVRKEWCEGATGERKARLDKLFDELKAELEKL